MNRYVVDGIIADIRAGKDVAFAGHRVDGDELFRRILDRLDGLSCKVTRASGHQSIRADESGGSLRILSTDLTGFRGISVDVFLLHGAAAHAKFEDIWPCLMSSAHGGEIIRL